MSDATNKGKQPMQPEAIDDIRRTWVAMQKFANDEPLTKQELLGGDL